MNCTVCDNPANPNDDYCAECRAAIDNFRRSITGDGSCTTCGRPAQLDGLCPECFDEICRSIVAHDALPPSARGGGAW
jgi:hypothetical protein